MDFESNKMIKIIRKVVILAFLFFYFLPLISKELTKKELIKTVQEADIYFYYDENFEKAAELYEALINIYPENPNFSAKLGICYLNNDGKKADALRLLSLASKNVVSNDREYIEYGDNAPLDTYLYLAIAYHRNDSLQKALSIYYESKKRLGSTGIFREDYIDPQIMELNLLIQK